MIDSIAPGQFLACLLEIGSSKAFDWDASALADWPDIAPTQPFSADPAHSSADSLAAAIHQAC
jgi:hypothetical protein